MDVPTLTITLRQLLDFKPQDDREKEIYSINQSILDNMKIDLDKDMYYLCGQVRLRYDDTINIDIFDKVREINKKREIEYGGPCNSWEAASILNHKKIFEETEKILKKYLEVMNWREKTK